MKMVLKILSVFIVLFCGQNIFCMGHVKEISPEDREKAVSGSMGELRDYFRRSGKIDSELMEIAIDNGNMDAVRYFYSSGKVKMPSDALYRYLIYLCNRVDGKITVIDDEALTDVGFFLANGASAEMCLIENEITAQWRRKWRRKAKWIQIRHKVKIAKKIEESKKRAAAIKERDSDYDFNDIEQEVRKFIKRRKKEHYL